MINDFFLLQLVELIELATVCAVGTMPTKIFVGNIAINTSRESLLKLFQQYGCVTECDILGNYGFVVSKPLLFFLQHDTRV